ncbi:MAG TPA: hypothetical protein HPP77_07945 [Candidatus Hydrogenedentes bacterium]|nr:hypothetical protein [Candidatus Hydrogenedentota bacterium]HIJ72727.1 hypothetical protein [Candidatus Hydrogenedentota bacterium]
MTDWGAHHFDIAQWGLGMDHTGPVEVIPPDGKDYKHLTYKYANGVEMRHIVYGPCVTFIGTEGKISLIGVTGESRFEPEEIGRECTYKVVDLKDAYGNKGHYDDFRDCVRTRRRPVADVEIGCRSITVCHIGNIAYRLNRPLKWNPDKEEFINDPQANRHLDRAKREPWAI